MSPIVFAQPAGLVSILSQDSFTDTNGTQLSSHTMDVGGGWTTVAHSGGGTSNPSQALIQGNQVQFTLDGVGVTTDIGASDGTVSTDWITSVGALNRNTLILRYNNTNNMIGINMREDNGDIRITKYDGGVLTVLDSDSYSFTEGVTYNIKATLSGSSITAYVDDVPVLSAISSFQQSSQIFGVGRNTGSNATRLDTWLATG